MSASILTLPEASALAQRVDHVFLYHVAVTTFFVTAIAGVTLFFIVRYRQRPDVPRRWPHRRFQGLIEAVWIGVPLALVMVMFFWGADIYVEGATFPADAEDILVIGKQWMWKTQHPGGQREINELHVPVGKPVRLIMTSQDVIHSFFVPAFRVKMDVLPGRYTFMWFTATKPGTYHLFCAQFCGTEHARMRGRVVALPPGDYARWLTQRSGPRSPEAQGAQLFADHGCVACHQSEDANRAPPLEGLYGSQVLLIDGSSVLADENYIRESIVAPTAKVVAGYQAIMPSFAQSLSDEELLALVTYIKSLGQKAPRPGGGQAPPGDAP